MLLARTRPSGRWTLGAAFAAAFAGLAFLLGASVTDGARLWRTRAGVIHGLASLPGGAPAAGVRIFLDQRVETLTDEAGEFTFRLVPPGDHSLTASRLAHRLQGEARVQVKKQRSSRVHMSLREVPVVGSTQGIIPVEGKMASYTDLALHRDILVGCAHFGGVAIYDVADATRPRLVGTAPAGSPTCESVLLSYPILYMGMIDAEGRRGLAVYSLQDPASPVEVSRTILNDSPWKMTLAADVLYAVGDRSFQAVDVRDPAAPSLLAELPFRGEGVAYRNGLVFLGTTPEVLIVLDVSDPSAPAVVWRSPELGEGYSKDCVLVDRFLYVGQASGIYQYDVLEPREPRLVNFVGAEQLAREGAVLQNGALGTGRIDLRDWVAYYSGAVNGLIAIDYQDQLRPRFGWQSDSEVPYAMNVTTDATRVYLASSMHGMRILRRR